jgi:hypothetical protein
MTGVLLLFDRSYMFLGEIVTRNGALERVLLNADGEQHLGPYLAEWHVRGIPIVRRVMQPAQGIEEAFYQERVPNRSHEFHAAFEAWAARSGVVPLDISSECVNTWEGMLRLPLENVERFSMLVTLRALPDHEHAAWHDAVAAAVTALETNNPSAKKKLLDLRKKTAGDLLKKLEKAAA